jgi:predicted PurR-regulated permease PerM
MAKKSSIGDPPDAEPVLLYRLHVWQVQAFRDILFAAAVIGIFWVGHALRAVTVPLLVALLLAYLFEPLVGLLCRVKWISRIRAVIFILATILIAVVLLIAIALPLLAGQTSRFVDDVQDGSLRAGVAKLGRYVPQTYTSEFNDLLEFLPGTAEAVPAKRDKKQSSSPASTSDRAAQPTEPSGQGSGASSTSKPSAPAADPQPSSAKVQDITGMNEMALTDLIDERVKVELDRRQKPTEDETRLLGLARKGAGTVVSAIGHVLGVGLLAFLIPFYFFFFSLYYREVLDFGRKLLPERNRARTLELLGKMDSVVAGFVRGRIVISLIMGLLLAIGWMICGVPYAFALGFIVGIFCAVPYLGIVGVPAAIGLLFFEQVGVPEAKRMALWAIILWPTVVFIIVQIIEGYALTPLIASKVTNLDPVTILVAVLAGGSVMGVYGMILAIPAAACAKIIVTDVLMPRVKAWIKGEAKDPLPIDEH